MNQIQNNIPVEEQEIDLLELIQRMWHNRKFIIRITLAFMLLGLLVALFSKKEYTASCDVVPQTSSSSTSSQMSSLARLAGINIAQNQDVKVLSPFVYENILSSTRFRKELMTTPIDFKKAARPVSFYDYYTNEEFNKPSVVDYIMKYTIGLPGVIIGAIRGEQPEPSYESLNEATTQIETLTKDEYRVVGILSGAVSLSLDDKKGYVTIAATMPEPLAAAQLAQATVDLLQKYITEFKVEKVQSNLDFVQQRHDEVKRDFEDVQARRARYRDANHNTIKNQARIEQERLEAEYQLAMNVYGELAMQLEQAKIKVKETTPILTIINPVTVPFNKSKPRRAMILFAFTLLGAVVGMGGVLLLPTVADIVDSQRMKGWIADTPQKED